MEKESEEINKEKNRKKSNLGKTEIKGESDRSDEEREEKFAWQQRFFLQVRTIIISLILSHSFQGLLSSQLMEMCIIMKGMQLNNSHFLMQKIV